MSKPTRRFSAGLATATIAGVVLLAPAAAHAADLGCASGQLAAPKQSRAPVYDESGTNQIGQLDSMTCAIDGKLIPNALLASAPGTYLVDFEGGIGRVEETYLAVFPSISIDSLDRLVVVKTDEKLSAGIWSALGDSADERYEIPAASGPFASAPIDSPEPGTVLRSSEARAQGQSNLAGVVSWSPVALAADHQVSWMVGEFLAEMPDSSWPVAAFEVPDEGYILYSDPLERQTIRAVDKGETLRISEAVSGWALTSDGEWLRAPTQDVEGDEKEAGETWQKLKDKAADAWDATKEKSKDLTTAAKDKVAEKKASSKTLTTGAMISSVVLSVIAAILAVAGLVTRRARGTTLATPAGIALTITSYVAAPASLAISLAAVSTAPFVWVWPPIIAGSVALLSVGSVYATAARIRGGHAHEDAEAMKVGLRSPLAIAAGVLTAVATFTASALAGLTWPAFLVALLGSAAAYGGMALTAKRLPEQATNTDTEQVTDTPAGVPVEAPTEAEPVVAE